VAATYDGATVRLYVNGVQVASQAATGPLTTSSNPVEIGGSAIDGGWFAGLIDDVRIYNTPLSAAQIQTDMVTPVATTKDTQAPTAPTNLVMNAISATQVSVTWAAATDNVGVASYVLERCQGAGCTNYTTIATITGTSYTDTGLTPSTSYSYHVDAVDAAGNRSSHSLPVSGTTPAPPALPAAPASPVPASGSTNVSSTTAVSWAAAANATQYDVAFGLTNPPAVVSTNQTTTSYQPSALMAATTYYWQVTAKGPGGSTSGPVWTLTTASVARPAPVAAYGFNENSGTTTADASGSGRTGTLSNTTWNTSGKNGGALSFNGSSSRVIVADAAALRLSNAMTIEAWVNPATAGSAAWQPIIYKSLDNYVLTTVGSPFMPAAGVTPNGVLALPTGANALPVNTWTHMAATYDGAVVRLYVNGVQVASQAATGSLATSTNPLEIGGSAIDNGWFSGLIDDVRIYNTALNAAQVQTDMMTAVVTDTQAPTSPPALAAAASSTSQITLTWTASTDNVGVTGYSIERCAGAGCTNFSQIGTSTSPGYSDTGLAAASTYVYRVRATDAMGNFSGYSSSVSAATLTPPPSAPASPAPAIGATGAALATTLAWSASTNASQYDVLLSATNPPTIVSANQSATSYQASALKAGTTYYWQVVAKGPGGSTSGSIWSFTTASTPAVPAGPAPAAGATSIAVTTALTWSASANATSYDVAFGTSNPPAIVSSNQTSLTYNPGTLLAGTKYFWQVVAKGMGGSTTGSVWSFTTAAAPAVPAGPAPAAGATSVAVTTALTWSASANATSYDVAFGTSNPPAVVSSDQTAASYQPAALIAGTTYYWQIVAKGQGGSTAGPVWTFATAAAVRPTPVAAYGFNEGKGTTTADASGNSRTGTVSNATWSSAGKNGGALSFNGSSSRVIVADVAALRLSNAMTVEAWVNPATTGAASWQPIVYKSLDNYVLTTVGSPFMPAAAVTPNGVLALPTGTSALPPNTWTHMAATYDGAMVRVYVNGVQVASQAATGSLATSTNPLEIGGSAIDNGWFSGLIDDVRVYNTALTASQVQADMTTPVSNVVANVVAAEAAPAVPSGPLPANNAANVLTTVALNWSASANATSYNVAFGTTNPPPTVATNQTATFYQPAAALAPGLTYFWQVTANGNGGSTPGPVWSFTAQSAAVAAQVSRSSTSSQPQPLRLMTWNINGGKDASGGVSVDAQVALMVNSGAQVIALQGVTISAAGDLSTLYQTKLENATSRTWNALWIADPRLASANPEGNLLLTTMPIDSSATKQFDSAPTDPTLLDSKRSAGWIGVIVNNVTVHIATTQLAVDAAARGQQMDDLGKMIATVPAPRLIGGDFNMQPGDAAYQTMASGFADEWCALAASGDPGITVSSFGRLDYWWSDASSQHVTPTAIQVVESAASTHKPVVLDVTVQ
jgi:endonuclease/exonuclease/phosphatase family metal-dependent hydrolase/fibronectin type 3 domain-containing protein